MYTAIQDSLQSKPHLGWYASDPTTIQSFRITPEGRGRDAFEYAQQRVSDQDVWGVVIVNANATSGAWNAITGGSTWERESRDTRYEDCVLTDSLGSDDVRFRRIKELLRRRAIPDASLHSAYANRLVIRRN